MLKSIKKVPINMSSSSSYISNDVNIDQWYDQGCDELLKCSSKVQNCSILKNIIRGAVLRVASDLSGGTVLENIKCRVTATSQSPIQACKDIISQPGGIWNLWTGTPSRMVEGSLMGGIFLVANQATKAQILNMGAGSNLAALCGGIVGGVAQSIIMTPTGLLFTSLNVNKSKPGHEHDTALSLAKDIVQKEGVQGLFVGIGPMAVRQASNWSSRSLFTELCRTNLQLSRFGLMGEIGSGIIGGLGSCWNTPIETVRVLMQRDYSLGVEPKTFGGYVEEELEKGGVPSLFRGITPRACQAVWQTVFMVVVPNLLGF